MSTSTRFVIKFPNDTYNRDQGFEADITEATVYPTRDKAEAVNSALMGGEVVEFPPTRVGRHNTPMNMQPLTPEAVRAHNSTHPFTPVQWKNREEPDLVVSWWNIVDKDGYFHAVLLAVITDKHGDYIAEWSSDYGWCGLFGGVGAPILP